MLWHQAAQASVPAPRAIQTQSFHNPQAKLAHSDRAHRSGQHSGALSSWLRLQPRSFVRWDKARARPVIQLCNL